MTADITSNAIVDASEDIISTVLNDEAVLLDLETDTYYTVNAVGAEIWEQIQGPTQVGDLRTILTDEYDLSETQAQLDLEEFLLSLDREGLIEIKDA
jgi:hypothetical protein